MIYLRNSGIEIYNAEACKRTLYFLAAEHVSPPVPENCCVVMVYPYDWTEMMTPWHGAGRGMESTGGGRKFADEFAAEIMGIVEASFCGGVGFRGIAGYSLGGLEALYMAAGMSDFDFAGSVSGSLWYSGALDFFAANPLDGRVKKVYLSLGDKEARTRDEARRSVRSNTDAVAKIIGREKNFCYEINEGGHFTEIAQRIGKCAGFFAQENITKV